MPSKVYVLDTDAFEDSDDGFTIVYFLDTVLELLERKEEDRDIKIIILTNNEIPDPSPNNPKAHLRFQSMLRLLTDLGLSVGKGKDVELYQGLKQTLLTNVHESTESFDYQKGNDYNFYAHDYLPDPEKLVELTADDQHHISKLRAYLASDEVASVEICGIGHSSNIAYLLSNQPDVPADEPDEKHPSDEEQQSEKYNHALVAKVLRVVMMAGGFIGASDKAEYNFRRDLEASIKLLKILGPKLHLLTYDITSLLEPINRIDHPVFLAIQHNFSDIYPHMAAVFSRFCQTKGFDSFLLHDMVAGLAFFNPKYFDFETVPVTIVREPNAPHREGVLQLAAPTTAGADEKAAESSPVREHYNVCIPRQLLQCLSQGGEKLTGSCGFVTELNEMITTAIERSWARLVERKQQREQKQEARSLSSSSSPSRDRFFSSSSTTPPTTPRDNASNNEQEEVGNEQKEGTAATKKQSSSHPSG